MNAQLVINSNAFALRDVINLESSAQFGKRIEPRVYVRRIARSTKYEKAPILIARTGVRTISSLACGFSPIKIHFSDYLKGLITRANEVIYFSIKYGYSDILLKKHKLHL